MKFQIFSICLALAIGISSCTCNQTKTSAKKEKEVKSSEINIVIERFEQDLFKCKTSDLKNELAQLEKKYPLFYPVYYNNVLNIPDFGDEAKQLIIMKEFIEKKAMKGLYDTVQQHFPNLNFLQNDLKILFTNYKSYFPQKPVPKVITCISEFSYSVFTVTDSIVGISLDKYLGPNYIYYADIFMEYSFMVPKFDKKYLAVDCANVLVANILPAPSDKSTLLDKMTTEGKLLYTLENLLPDKKETDIIKYSSKEWQWCLDNEQQIWSFFLNKDLLYDTQFEQVKYIKDGPNTYGMPSNSPGKVGGWLGWQIVRKYMQQHPNITLKELYAISDGQKILTGSKYKPKSK